MSRASIGSDGGGGGGSIDWSRPQASPMRRKIEKAISKASVKVVNTFIEDTKLEDVDPVPEHIKNFEENYVFDPSARSHKELILDEADDRVKAVEHEGQYQVKKWTYFSICIFSNIVGIFVTLFSLGKSDLFDSFEPNIILTYCSTIFYIPTLIWFKAIFFPGKKESMWRSMVLQQRAWRRKVYYQQRRVYLGRDIEDAREAEEEAQMKAIKESHERAKSGNKSAIATWEKSQGKSSGSIKTSISSSKLKPSPTPLTPILQSSESRKSVQSLATGKSNKRISFQV